jgi:hypothetical protein
MIDFMYRSLFTGETHEEGPSGRALVVQWILLSVVVGLVLASGEGSLVFVFTCLFAAVTIALGVLWQAAWLGVVTRQPAAAYVRVLAAALWPLLLAGPVAALGRLWPGSTGLLAAGLIGWMAIILFRGIARRVGTGLPGAAGALAGAVSLGFLAGTAVLGAPILAIWLLASF